MSQVYHLTEPARARILSAIESALAERDDLAFAMVFGSVVDSDAVHDVDVGIWTTAGASPRADMEIASGLSAGLQLPIDVRRLNDAPVPFLFHALRGRPALVRDEALLAAVMERTAREYHDRAPRLRLAMKEAFAR